MKMLARSYVYWPKINQDIEKVVLGCETCQITQNVPRNKDVLVWESSGRVWERIHIDFLDIAGVKMLLIVDSFSRWIDAHVMHGTDCKKTVV